MCLPKLVVDLVEEVTRIRIENTRMAEDCARLSMKNSRLVEDHARL
jgi:hypothetical protein